VTPEAAAGRPDPATEIRIVSLSSLRGLNYWSNRPVVCMDLTIGAFDNISSADVPGITESLVAALPGLTEHRCSVGRHGGFVTRLEQGTYMAHIVEHVALELQNMVGYDVGYGRTRGGDADASYTVAFEYRHEQVGLRAGALGLAVVQRAFAGSLDTVQPVLRELEALALTPDAPAIRQRVFCGVTGSSARAETQRELAAAMYRLGRPGELVVEVSPAYLLRAGLPYFASDMAIILDTQPTDVPVWYQDAERAQRLTGVLVEAVTENGLIICPVDARDLQERALERSLRIAVFSTEDRRRPAVHQHPGADDMRRDVTHGATYASVRDGRIILAYDGKEREAGRLRRGTPRVAQVATALAEHMLDGGSGNEGHAVARD
jgi:cyanophycin synthetase